MSRPLTALARQAGRGLPRADAHVLLVLATYADSAAVCWPSVAAVAADCGVGTRVIRRSLQGLQAGGLLEDLGETRPGGPRRRRLTLPAPVVDDSPGTPDPLSHTTPPAADDTTPLHSATYPPVADDTQKSQEEPVRATAAENDDDAAWIAAQLSAAGHPITAGVANLHLPVDRDRRDREAVVRLALRMLTRGKNPIKSPSAAVKLAVKEAPAAQLPADDFVSRLGNTASSEPHDCGSSELTDAEAAFVERVTNGMPLARALALRAEEEAQVATSVEAELDAHGIEF